MKKWNSDPLGFFFNRKKKTQPNPTQPKKTSQPAVGQKSLKTKHKHILKAWNLGENNPVSFKPSDILKS